MFNRNKIRKIAIVVVWLLVIAMVITTFSFSIFAAESTGSSKTVSDQLSDMEKVLKIIESNYVDDVDMEVLIEGAYKGIFSELDPYSSYYSADDNTGYVYSTFTGSFYGIGATFTNTDKGIEIKTINEGSAAEKAGLQPGDVVSKINGVSYENKTVEEAIEAIRSKAQTPVKLTIIRDGKSVDYKIKRELIELESVTGKMIDSTTAYIKISNFYTSTEKEFVNMWNEMNGAHPEIKNLILDLRNNTGGLVNTALSLSNLFLDDNMVIMHYVRQNKIEYTYIASEEKLINIPVTILVNDKTASASEIFTGALKDNGKATVVGGVTYGKGMAQVVGDLKNGAMVKLSKYYFTTPNNYIIEGKGIKPDYLIYNGDNKEAKQRYEDMKTVAEMNEGKKYFKGEKGLNVYAAQQRLKILGFEGITLNGTLDEATMGALKQIQKSMNLYPYGALDFSTVAALEKTYQQNLFGISEDVQLNKALELTKN